MIQFPFSAPPPQDTRRAPAVDGKTAVPSSILMRTRQTGLALHSELIVDSEYCGLLHKRRETTYDAVMRLFNRFNGGHGCGGLMSTITLRTHTGEVPVSPAYLPQKYLLTPPPQDSSQAVTLSLRSPTRAPGSVNSTAYGRATSSSQFSPQNQHCGSN